MSLIKVAIGYWTILKSYTPVKTFYQEHKVRIKIILISHKKISSRKSKFVLVDIGNALTTVKKV